MVVDIKATNRNGWFKGRWCFLMSLCNKYLSKSFSLMTLEGFSSFFLFRQIVLRVCIGSLSLIACLWSVSTQNSGYWRRKVLWVGRLLVFMVRHEHITHG